MLWNLVSDDVFEKAKSCGEGDDVAVINCVQNGIFKAWGKCQPPKIPVIMKAKYFSKMAETKIVQAGGICVLIS